MPQQRIGAGDILEVSVDQKGTTEAIHFEYSRGAAAAVHGDATRLRRCVTVRMANVKMRETNIGERPFPSFKQIEDIELRMRGKNTFLRMFTSFEVSLRNLMAVVIANQLVLSFLKAIFNIKPRTATSCLTLGQRLKQAPYTYVIVNSTDSIATASGGVLDHLDRSTSCMKVLHRVLGLTHRVIDNAITPTNIFNFVTPLGTSI